MGTRDSESAGLSGPLAVAADSKQTGLILQTVSSQEHVLLAKNLSGLHILWLVWIFPLVAGRWSAAVRPAGASSAPARSSCMLTDEQKGMCRMGTVVFSSYFIRTGRI